MQKTDPIILTVDGRKKEKVKKRKENKADSNNRDEEIRYTRDKRERKTQKRGKKRHQTTIKRLVTKNIIQGKKIKESLHTKGFNKR